jgi:hypothetical protein
VLPKPRRKCSPTSGNPGYPFATRYGLTLRRAGDNPSSSLDPQTNRCLASFWRKTVGAAMGAGSGRSKPGTKRVFGEKLPFFSSGSDRNLSLHEGKFVRPDSDLLAPHINRLLNE